MDIATTIATRVATRVDLSKTSYYIALASIAFNPTFWNIAARTEYKTHFITKLAFGKPKLGCYLLAVTIFSLGLLRDFLYERALAEQPTCKYINNPYAQAAGVVAFGVGNVLVASSMWKLGVTGTYLGDYFGILMDERVTSFPFNVTDNPMYNGSTLCFLGTALWYGKPAGIFASIFVFFMYKIALKFEEPFTAKIYALRDQKKQ